MKKAILGGLIILSLIVSLVASCAKEEAPTEEAPTTAPPRTITIVDSAGRAVEVPYPVESMVVLNTGAAEIIRALGAKDRIIGITKSMAKRPEYFPDLKDKPQCGWPWDYEKIVELNPQVVIAYSSHGPFEEKKVEPAGLKVVKLDFYKPEALARGIRTLGVMLGKEERAAELINFFEGYLSTVNSRIKELKAEEKVRVYFEGETNYRSAAEGSGYHDMILMAGGINIFAGAGVPYPIVKPEDILLEKPQVVVKNTKMGGYTGTDASELKAIRDELLQRPGWTNLDAVQNNRVYIISSEITGYTMKPIAICYLAKWFYPDKFQDLDPEAMLRKYLEEFQGLEYKGVWVYSGS